MSITGRRLQVNQSTMRTRINARSWRKCPPSCQLTQIGRFLRRVVWAANTLSCRRRCRTRRPWDGEWHSARRRRWTDETRAPRRTHPHRLRRASRSLGVRCSGTRSFWLRHAWWSGWAEERRGRYAIYYYWYIHTIYCLIKKSLKRHLWVY